MAMTREEFASFVNPPQLKFIHDCVHQGLDDYASPDNYSNVARLAHSSSLRAHIRNDHIVYRANIMLASQPDLGIRFATRRNRRLFLINGRARLSFKKLNRNLRHSNYPTQQALDYDAQLWPVDVLNDPTLAGVLMVPLWDAAVLAPPTNLVSGYLANDAETEFEVFIVCPDGEGNAWDWPLTNVDIVELLGVSNPAATNAASKIRKRRLQLLPGAIRKQGTDATGQL